MFRELNIKWSYARAMTVLTALSVVSGLLASAAGAFWLPLSAAALALLFVFEDPRKRFLSYIASAVTVFSCFLFNGIYSVIGVETVILALILASLYVRKVSKGEVAFYLTITVVLLEVLSLYLAAAGATGSFNPADAISYYEAALAQLRSTLTEAMVNYFKTIGTEVMGDYAVTFTDLEALVDSLASILLGLVVISAFVFVGITMKIFSFAVRRICKYGILKCFSRFGANNVVSYFYVAVAALSIFATGDGVFEIALANINAVLIVVFAYIGIKYLFSVAAFTGRRAFGFLIIIAAFAFAGGEALRIISYIGVYINISINKNLSLYNSGDENKA